MTPIPQGRLLQGRAGAPLLALLGGGAVAFVGPPEWMVAVLLGGIGALVGHMTGSQRVRLILAGGVFLALFVAVYIGFVAPAYAYRGSVFVPSDVWSLGVAITVAALPLLWLPCAVERPSHVILWLLYLFAYVPATIVPILSTGDLLGVAPLMATVAAGLGIVAGVARLPLGHMAYRGLSPTTWLAVLIAAVLAVDAYIVISYGVPTSIPAFDSVYDTRSDFVEATATVLGPAGYVVPWAGNVLNPLLFAVGIASRRWWLVGLSLVGTLLIYSVTGYKSVVLGPVLALGLYAAVQYRRDRFGSVFLIAAAVLVASSTALTAITGSPWGLSLISQRLLALPGVLITEYYAFFASHPVYELRHSVLGFLGPPPYEVVPPRLIGLVVFGNPDTGANASIWADGIANFWLPGALGMSVVYGLALRLLDVATERRDLRIVVPALGLMGLSVSNSATLTALLTHGLLFMIVLVALLPEADFDRRPRGALTWDA